MNPENFYEAKWRKVWHNNINRGGYLEKHPEFLKFDFSETYYFRILDDRMAIHWAVIRPEDGKWSVYFINVEGRAFDKLIFKSKKIAQRRLRKNKFFFSTNKKCPYTPVNPIYVRLSSGKKSAPYSKGNLWIKSEREQLQQ